VAMPVVVRVDLAAAIVKMTREMACRCLF
jgi:hypothetical protein